MEKKFTIISYFIKITSLYNWQWESIQMYWDANIQQNNKSGVY